MLLSIRTANVQHLHPWTLQPRHEAQRNAVRLPLGKLHARNQYFDTMRGLQRRLSADMLPAKAITVLTGRPQRRDGVVDEFGIIVSENNSCWHGGPWRGRLRG